jgi:hypothetical protein
MIARERKKLVSIFIKILAKKHQIQHIEDSGILEF